MGQAKARLDAARVPLSGGTKEAAEAARPRGQMTVQVVVNLPKGLHERMERIRPGVHINGKVPDRGDFVAFLVDRMLFLMVQAAQTEKAAKEAKDRKDALVKLPQEVAKEEAWKAHE